jgi:hypothetical protein
MPCLIVLIALFAPRVALVIMWLFTGFIGRAFDGFLIPLLGFIFLPWTTIVYALVAPGGLSLLNIVFLVLAFMADIGSFGGGWRSRRR